MLFLIEMSPSNYMSPTSSDLWAIVMTDPSSLAAPSGLRLLFDGEFICGV